MSSLAVISATCLNQFALDFEGNFHRILKSIEIAKAQGSRFRCGPELEISGYNCEDHFYESDTLQHSWEVLAQLMDHPICKDILVDVGMPVMHKGVTYNCRIVFLNKKILLIRPKMSLANNGNYRETRWFTAWVHKRTVEEFHLPPIITNLTGQSTTSFGDALVRCLDTVIGFEICEELWSPMSTHIDQTLAGAEIIVNGSGSHTEIRKASHALDLIKAASSKCGGVYVFNNLRGCDGERVYLSGNASVVSNGEVLLLGEQYSLVDVEVLTATIDLNEVRIYMTSMSSRNVQGAASPTYPSVEANWALGCTKGKVTPKAKETCKHFVPTPILKTVEFCCPEEEIARGPALWLWDALRRSSASGFFLPLSGGVDSSAVAIIVYSMCKQIVEFIKEKDSQASKGVLADVRKVVRDKDFFPKDAQTLVNSILTTCYMGSANSSVETRKRAKDLATAIGSNHSEIDITSAVQAFVGESSSVLKQTPDFSGERAENLALQNVQARTRMVFAYMLGQLTPWASKKNGFLLVLGTANVDEAIRGYFTKYDCSSADLNPIGGISKTDLKAFIIYAGQKFGFPELSDIVSAPPTAELQPLASNQTDEQDMGMTYEELSYFGKLRKPLGCGPYSMVARLLHLWGDKHAPQVISDKVKHFYRSYASNRHKMSVLTPACHMENYGPEDHRYDLRPIFYPLDFTWQFRKIDELVRSVEDEVD